MSEPDKSLSVAERERLIHEHLAAVHRLRSEEASPSAGWPPKGYYFLWHVLVGAVLGSIGAGLSLLANVIGAPFFNLPPLQIIRVYLTFPMGERALTADTGVVMFVGAVLYLLTGALYGVAFHLVMSTYLNGAPARRRFVVATLIGLGLWIVNFYLLLSWLQPLLLGGNWIVRMVPFWVAGLTHLAFAWTMLAIESWGQFSPYAREEARS